MRISTPNNGVEKHEGVKEVVKVLDDAVGSAICLSYIKSIQQLVDDETHHIAKIELHIV